MLPAGRMSGGGRLWLYRPVETGGTVAWQCHRQWVAGLVVAAKHLAAGCVAAPALLLAKVVAALAAEASRPVVGAR